MLLGHRLYRAGLRGNGMEKRRVLMLTLVLGRVAACCEATVDPNAIDLFRVGLKSCLSFHFLFFFTNNYTKYMSFFRINLLQRLRDR